MGSRWQELRSGGCQRGVSVLELMLTLPVLIVLAYGSLIYGYVFFLNRSLNDAVQKATRLAAATGPVSSEMLPVQQARLRHVVERQLGWADDRQQHQRLSIRVNQTSTTCPTPVRSDRIKVEAAYALRKPSWLVPVLNLGISQIPPLPDTLNACASEPIRA